MYNEYVHYKKKHLSFSRETVSDPVVNIVVPLSGTVIDFFYFVILEIRRIFEVNLNLS